MPKLGSKKSRFSKKSKCTKKTKENCEMLEKKLDNIQGKLKSATEIKYNTFGNNNVTLATDTIGMAALVPSNWDLLTISQGLGPTARSGQQINLTSVRLNLSLRPVSMDFSGDYHYQVRILIFAALYQTSVIPPIQNLLLPEANTFGMESTYNPVYVPSKFKVYYDRVIDMDVTSRQLWHKKITIPVNRKIVYDDATGTFDHITKGAMFMYVFHKHNSLAPSELRFDLMRITRYKDI